MGSFSHRDFLSDTGLTVPRGGALGKRVLTTGTYCRPRVLPQVCGRGHMEPGEVHPRRRCQHRGKLLRDLRTGV